MWFVLYKKFVWSRIKGCNMSAWRDDVQHIGGFGQAANIDDFDEILQTSDIHHIIPLFTPCPLERHLSLPGKASCRKKPSP
jgi:hypothetical protein